MYGWEGRPFDDIARLCLRRDPRRYPWGLLTAAGEREALQWFRDPRELSGFLRRMEPQRWGIRLADLVEFKACTEELFVQLDVFGPSEELRQAHNALSLPAFEVRWWGSFEQLCADGGAAAGLRQRLLGDEQPVTAARVDAFAAALTDAARGS